MKATLDTQKFVESLLTMKFTEKEKEKMNLLLEERDIMAPFKIVQLAFQHALRDQGLKYDFDKKETVEIEPETKWYVAIDNYGIYHNDVLGDRPLFLKGERTTFEKIITLCPGTTDEDLNKYFVPLLDLDKDNLKEEVIKIFDKFNIIDSGATIGGLRDDVLRAINNSTACSLRENTHQSSCKVERPAKRYFKNL